VAFIEALTVLVLRAHYTMDVFAAILAAAVAARVAVSVAPSFDRLLARIIHERSVFVNNASRRCGGTQG
jgi:membrane-associated phospholipid phosphatase